MKKLLVIIILMFTAVFLAGIVSAMSSRMTAGEGKKIWIGADYYFTYQFSQRPAIGTSIIKIQVFDKNNNKTTALGAAGSVSMPSMGSAHDSGMQVFQKNKKKDYLLPVSFVMQGEWEINIVFNRGKKEYARTKIVVNI